MEFPLTHCVRLDTAAVALYWETFSFYLLNQLIIGVLRKAILCTLFR